MSKIRHIYADGTSDMTEQDNIILREELLKNPIINISSVETGESQTKHVSEFLNKES